MTGLRDTYTGLYAGDTPKTQFIDQDYVSSNWAKIQKVMIGIQVIGKTLE